MHVHRVPHLVVLRRGEPSPLARESDEEKPAEKKEGKEEKDGKDKAAAKPVVIDFDGIGQRILALPMKPGNYTELRAGAAGQVYYLENPAERGLFDEGSSATLK